jgi:hypothetical protein
MYCNNCGKFLLESDKFCSNCGTRVFLNEQSIEKVGPPEGFKPDTFENQTPKPTPPLENIKWNIEDFPGHDVKKTEEINFDWGNTSDFKKPEATAEEIALNPAPKADTSVPTDGGFIAAIEEIIIQGKDLEEEIFAEASLVESIPAAGDLHKRNKIVDKFYTFNKKNEEFQKLLDREYEKIKEGTSDGLDEQAFRDSVSEINQKSNGTWSEFNPTEHIAEMALARERFFGPAVDPFKDTKKEETPFVVPETSNLPGEEPLPEDNILPDLEICKDEQTLPANVEAACAPIEPETAQPFTTPLDNHVIPEDFEDPKPEAEAMLAEEPQSEVETSIVEEPEQEAEALKPEELEPKDEAPKPEEPEGEASASKPEESEDESSAPKPVDDVLSIRDKWIKYEEEEDEEDEHHSGGKVGKFIIGFLILLLLTQMALLGVKLVAPESAVAQFVDDKVQQVIQFFQGSDNTSHALVIDRNVAAENKTGLIQMQVDKNYNDKINTIKYNEELHMNTAMQYSDESLNNSTVLQNNKWYTKNDGSIVYYDEQAVGAVISYESAKKLAEGESFETLEIGEVRISNENLYVWVAEEITPGERQEKILRIIITGETMNVDTEYDL